MLKKSASSVLGSSKSSTYPKGTPPVSTRLRPCRTVFLSILRDELIWFIWLVWFNQIYETNQTNKTNQLAPVPLGNRVLG
jgi:hypothetical protein